MQKAVNWIGLESRILAAVVGLIMVSIVGCTGGSSIDDGSSSLDVGEGSLSGTTDSDGTVTLDFPVTVDAVSFQLVLQSGGEVASAALFDPNSEDITRSSSEAVRSDSSDSTSPYVINFPYRARAVSAGTYRVRYHLVNGQTPLANADVRLTFFSKKDSDLNNGNLKLNIVLVGPVADSEETTSALDKSLEVMKQIYSRAGISIDPAWYSFAGPATLPDPRSNDPFYGDIATHTRPGAVNIVLGSDVKGLGSGESEFGRAGSIPGSFTLTNKSVIALGILEVTGRDGRFNYTDEPGATERHNDERRLAGEEIARLTARYLGLENIIEFSGQSVTGSDSLSDTPSCLSYTGCRTAQAARNNFMFPFPLREFDDRERGDNEYFARDNVTDQQREVINRSIFVD